uniref:G-protein coupled receptors family 1 profile domain-containing protein n=1 Tax=Plectus sambesii TaxID=2011161 RepID=A0A914UR64_9BILA
MLGNTLAESGWIPEVYIFLGSLSARLSNVGLFGFGLAQNFGVFSVAINRYTAYMRPMKHNKIWTDKFVRGLIILQWALSFICITPVMFYFEYEIVLLNDSRTVLLQWKDAGASTMYTIVITGLTSGAIAISIVVIYTIIFCTAFIRKIRSQEPISKVEKTALKMAVTGFICSVGLLIYLIDTYIFFGSYIFFGLNFPDVPTYWLTFNIGHSIYAAVNPYAMFLF